VRPIALLLAVLVLIGSPAAKAADKDADGAILAAITTKDTDISLEDLTLMLEPMTRGELEAEAKGWFALLRNKVREISVAELAVNRKNREIAQLEKEKTAAKELAKATTEVKTKEETGGEVSEKEKAAAAERLAQAQKKLAKTVDTANKVAAKDAEKVEAAAAANAGAPAEASANSVAPVANDQEVLRRAVTRHSVRC
jgi:small conductance mechanosensitive channel